MTNVLNRNTKPGRFWQTHVEVCTPMCKVCGKPASSSYLDASGVVIWKHKKHFAETVYHKQGQEKGKV